MTPGSPRAQTSDHDPLPGPRARSRMPSPGPADRQEGCPSSSAEALGDRPGETPVCPPLGGKFGAGTPPLLSLGFSPIAKGRLQAQGEPGQGLGLGLGSPLGQLPPGGENQLEGGACPGSRGETGEDVWLSSRPTAPARPVQSLIVPRGRPCLMPPRTQGSEKGNLAGSDPSCPCRSPVGPPSLAPGGRHQAWQGAPGHPQGLSPEWCP